MDDFKQAQAKFLEEQKQLRQKLKESTEDDRDRIRTEIQAKRETFLEQQRDTREEIRKRLTELKDRLKDHTDVIEAAQDQAKDKAKGRKGGD